MHDNERNEEEWLRKKREGIYTDNWFLKPSQPRTSVASRHPLTDNDRASEHDHTSFARKPAGCSATHRCNVNKEPVAVFKTTIKRLGSVQFETGVRTHVTLFTPLVKMGVANLWLHVRGEFRPRKRCRGARELIWGVKENKGGSNERNRKGRWGW